MDEIKVMKVGSGKQAEVDPVTGTRTRIRSYAYRSGKSLRALLKENKRVKVVAMGESSVNNMVKAIAHAQTMLEDEGLALCSTSFAFEDVEVNDGADTHTIKAVSILVDLVE